jgi:predicted amidohydrolase
VLSVCIIGTEFQDYFLAGSDGRLLNRHRKVMPTMAERMWWGKGDGRSLVAAETAAGRVGSLICWEHWMPLARAAMHAASEDVHVAAWPRVRTQSEPMGTAQSWLYH